MSGPVFCLLCLLLLLAFIAVPLLTLTAEVEKERSARSSSSLRCGGFEARRVTVKEHPLDTSTDHTAPTGCVFVGDVLRGSCNGWAMMRLGSEGVSGEHSGAYVAPSAEHRGSAMAAVVGALVRVRAAGSTLPAGEFVEINTIEGWARVQLADWRAELVVTYPAPHHPIRAKAVGGGYVRELFFIPDLISDLASNDEWTTTLMAGQNEAMHAGEAGLVAQEAASLCLWARQDVVTDEESGTCGAAATAGGRSRRQTEVVVINRRKKHGGGDAAAVAIGLGVGLGVGIPVVVLLALIPCVLALWIIRRRRSKTIRVADVPTGVFATGQVQNNNPVYQDDEYQGSDLQSALGENY
jgi:hypothetical protein